MDKTSNEWNASLNGDYLWSSVNFGEAVTETMTPLTWSVIQFTLKDWKFLPGYPTVGNIGGIPYLNISIFATLFRALRHNKEDLLKYLEGTLYMELPDNMVIPVLKLSPLETLTGLFFAVKVQLKQQRGVRQLSRYLSNTPNWFQNLRMHLVEIDRKEELIDLWEREIAPHVKQGVWCVLGSVTQSANYALKLRKDLTNLVGPEDANILISNLSNQEDLLASLGLVAGISKLARGEITRLEYLEKYGHRGPHEFELSVPPPAEDSRWIDEQLQHFQEHPVNVDDLLTKQRAAYQAAWERLQNKHPRQGSNIQKQILENARRARLRELARSEYTRDRWLVRLFALRAAELTDLDDNVFFLSLDELSALLSGQPIALSTIATRKKAYQQYKALPAYPSIIRGRFEPVEWAAKSHLRSDIFDANIEHQINPTNIITGSPGSTGQVTGIVRVVEDLEQGQELCQGEVLVAVQTDVTWTLLFPRAAAVITDIGAPLSHAAIVARELGIPAVVGCGDATTRLKTGDYVQVDGARGSVKILTDI